MLTDGFLYTPGYTSNWDFQICTCVNKSRLKENLSLLKVYIFRERHRDLQKRSKTKRSLHVEVINSFICLVTF